MTISKKGLRRISVDNQEYVWRAISDDDGGFQITVCLPERRGQLLIAYIHIICDNGILIITNYIVRQMILLGLANDWTPNEQKSPLYLKRINEKIDLEKATYCYP